MITKPLNKYIPKGLKRPLPLGNAIAAVAEPVARVLRIEDCSGCDKRIEKLNAAVPNINPFAHGP